MRVRFIKQRSLPAVGSSGPFTRVFEIGEVHDLPLMHATTFIAQGDAVKDEVKNTSDVEPVVEDEPVVEQPVKKAAPRKRKK
jgi:hypothetical protein